MQLRIGLLGTGFGLIYPGHDGVANGRSMSDSDGDILLSHRYFVSYNMTDINIEMDVDEPKEKM